jgi:hypothetical protein
MELVYKETTERRRYGMSLAPFSVLQSMLDGH